MPQHSPFSKNATTLKLDYLKHAAAYNRDMSNDLSTSGGATGFDPILHRYIRAKDLPSAFASREIARRVVKAGWIKSAISAKRYTIYKRLDVEAAQARMERGELPPPL